jgi:hypothetical protein
MTPEEVARAVVRRFDGDEYWIDVEAAIVAVAAAIRAERVATVERCAHVVEMQAGDHSVAQVYAAAIRALE